MPKFIDLTGKTFGKLTVIKNIDIYLIILYNRISSKKEKHV